MLPNPQEAADLATFTEEILKSLTENFIFCAVTVAQQIIMIYSDK